MSKGLNDQDILSLSRNFMECRILLTGAELDMFTLLAEPSSSIDLAAKQGWHERHLTVVLNALAAMELLIKKDGKYQTDPGLLPGGRLVIRDHVMAEDKTTPKSGALFAINMLVGTPGGGTYTFDEIKAGLVDAGFETIRLIQGQDHMMGLVEAFRPA